MKFSANKEFVFLYRNLCTRRVNSPLPLATEYENEIKKERRTGRVLPFMLHSRCYKNIVWVLCEVYKPQLDDSTVISTTSITTLMTCTLCVQCSRQQVALQSCFLPQLRNMFVRLYKAF